MNALARSLRNPRVLGPAAILVVVLLVLLLRGDGTPLSTAPPDAAVPSPSPPAEHAAWSFRVVPAGSAGRVTNRHRRAVEAEEEAVAAVAAGVNDALILGEGELTELEAGALTPDAARALGRSPLTLGEDVTDVLARRRHARIGVDVHGAKRAVATSVVVAHVTTETRQVRVRYETTLWMERVRAGWRVFAFDGKRRRA